MSSSNVQGNKIAVFGLGYVGLPLAIEFGKSRPVVGYDINEIRISDLKNGYDKTLEVSDEELASAPHVTYSSQLKDVAECNVFIVTVPTPIDEQKRPDLKALINASREIGSVLKNGDVVVYESTVYPGATEEDCVPILEEVSGLIFNKDFFVGYSPERINPGDKSHRLHSIRKVTAGSTPEVAEFVDDLYRSIIAAGTYKAPSIRVAEAAKVIENTQRDLNIALMNELAKIFDRLGIATKDVLDAAATKWNFMPFYPGLVGGHCIGVDPYYLTAKAEAVGYLPEVILAGRRTNDSMGAFVAQRLVKLLARSAQINDARVGILGISFKEDVPDLRNSRVPDIVRELEDFGITPIIHDPLVSVEEARREFGLELVSLGAFVDLDAVIFAVPHAQYLEDIEHLVEACLKPNGWVFDIRSRIKSQELSCGINYWSL